MSASEYYTDDSSTSFEFDDVDDYELEVEEFDAEGDEGSSTKALPDREPDSNINVYNSAVPVSYDDEPLADEEWIRDYEEERETERNRVEALQKRLEGTR